MMLCCLPPSDLPCCGHAEAFGDAKETLSRSATTDSDECSDLLLMLPQDLLSPGNGNGVFSSDLLNTVNGHNGRHSHGMLPVGSSSQDDLNADECQSDEFKMYRFKVEMCNKKFVHDWRTCPFSHPTENARRRDPRIYTYAPVPCPSYKKGICLRGDACPYSHGVYEAWLHPAKYRTQLCKEGHLCRRPVCFFAHSLEDLRQPTPLSFDDDSSCADVSDSKTDVFNNMSESGQGSGSGTGSDVGGSSSDSGRINNFPASEDHCPGTPPCRKAQAAMPTTGDVSMLGIGSPGSLLSEDCHSEGSGAFNNGMMNGFLNGNTSGYMNAGNGTSNGYGNGYYRRRSVDFHPSVGDQQPPYGAAAGPRMSQAVARKLGLANPSRQNSNASSMSGIVSPPRRSFDAPVSRVPVSDYRRSADVYLERDLLNAIAYNSERVVVGGMRPSLVQSMNGLEDSHAKAMQQQATADSLSSLMSSLNGINLDGFGTDARRDL